jgi:radical SAM protein with 4Fe4S-binding SPASM domain
VKASVLLKSEGVPFQINSTVTPGNISDIEGMLSVARNLGAVAFHVFLLVPTGRASNWDEVFPAPEEYERALRRLCELEPRMELEFKATCAPQYHRIGLESGLSSRPPAGIGLERAHGQNGGHGHAGGHGGASPSRRGKGCLGGQGFMFVGHDGSCGACGYLPISAGNVREQPVADIYAHSPLFLSLRDKSRYHGKCSVCEYWAVCGGCRARAHAQGDYLGEEPLCPHLPVKLSGRSTPDSPAESSPFMRNPAL